MACWSLEKSDLETAAAAANTELRVNVRPATEAHAEEAVEALKDGKVIAVPTDTLYGFACDAWYAISSPNQIYGLPSCNFHTTLLLL